MSVFSWRAGRVNALVNVVNALVNVVIIQGLYRPRSPIEN